MSNKGIGTIYKTKPRKLSEGNFEFYLIGITGKKSYQIIKYQIALKQVTEQKEKPPLIMQNSKPAIDDKNIEQRISQIINGIKNAAKEDQSKEYILNSTIELTPISHLEIEISDNQGLSDYIKKEGFNLEDLIEITYVEPENIKRNFEIIAKEIVEKSYGNEFTSFADEILMALTGRLSPENTKYEPVKMEHISRSSYANPATFLAAIREYFIDDESFYWLGIAMEIQEKYINLLKNIFIGCGIDIEKIKVPNITWGWEGEENQKSIGFRNELAQNPMLIYEYLLSLNNEKLLSFYNEIYQFYTDLINMCKKEQVDGGTRTNQFHPVLKRLSESSSRYRELSSCNRKNIARALKNIATSGKLSPQTFRKKRKK